MDIIVPYIESNTKFYSDYCLGGKTGYTGEAKNCVVEYAEKDGVELIAIVMGENAKVKGQKFLDAKRMFEYIFDPILDRFHYPHNIRSYVMMYYLNGINAIIVEWLNNECDKTTSEISKIISIISSLSLSLIFGVIL